MKKFVGYPCIPITLTSHNALCSEIKSMKSLMKAPNAREEINKCGVRLIRHAEIEQLEEPVESNK
jgi:hypothetical protein